MPSFTKLKPLQNGEITLSFTEVGKSYPCHEFIMWQNMSFNSIPENKILANLSEFIVPLHIYVHAGLPTSTYK